MSIIKLFVSMVILFVSVNLLMVLHKTFNLKMREGLDVMGNKKKCMSGCVKHKGIDGDCDNKIYKDDDDFYRKCSYRCPGPNDPLYDPDQECEYNQNCEPCGTFRIETDSKGYALKSDDSRPGSISKNQSLLSESEDFLGKAASETENTSSSWYKDFTNDMTSSKEMGPNGTWRKDETDSQQITRQEYEAMGRKFLKDESERKNIDAPPILDSEAEVMGRLVWRVYLAEKKQKKSKNPNLAKQKTMERETQLINKLSQIYRTHSDSQKINAKQNPLYKNSTNVNTDTSSRMYTNQRTTGVMSSTGTFYPTQSHHMSIVHNYEISGPPLPGHPKYTDLTIAIDKCGLDRACGGVNVTKNKEYILMPVHAPLNTKNSHKAYVKTSQKANIDAGIDLKKSEKQLELSRSLNPSQSITSSLGVLNPHARYKTGLPRNPNLKPTPYNSLMDLFS